VLRHRDLEQIALIALRCTRVLMQSGSSGRVIHECGALLARSQDVQLLGLRVGYASITITLGHGENTITRMVAFAGHGVNHRLDQAVRALVREAAHTGMAPAEIGTRLDALLADVPRYPGWLVAIAVGVACAAFAGLLGADARALPATFLASGVGQAARQFMHRRGVNAFVIVAVVALLSALLGGLGARLAGSGTPNLALFGATLLLVPGVPATNVQADVVDGLPTLGSARAVSVLMVMVFVAVGIWLAQILLGMPA
jgi:uncharacterized membrane protein YjjP (DUF1212 family)